MIKLAALAIVVGLTLPRLALAAFATAVQPVTLPGTGIHLIPPAGMALGAAGSALVDDSGETIIVFGTSDAKHSVENDPTWRALYKRPPEHVAMPALSGNLYRRTKAADGGTWDGWYFAVQKGDRVLTVMASYTGNVPGAFDRLRENLLTITWGDNAVDSELAMGVKLAPRGLQLVKGNVGALSYREGGQLGGTGPSLLLQSLPVPVGKANAIFATDCESVVSAPFRGKPFAAPKFLSRDGIGWCETWSTMPEAEMSYVAMIRLPNGALISAMGSALSDRFQESLPIFRAAIQNLQLIPARLGVVR